MFCKVLRRKEIASFGNCAACIQVTEHWQNAMRMISFNFAVAAYPRRDKPKFGAFSRSFRLPADADETGVDAKLKDGVLTIVVPKHKEIPSGTKKVAINAS